MKFVTRCINKQELENLKSKLEYIPEFWKKNESQEYDTKILNQLNLEKELIKELNTYLKQLTENTAVITITNIESQKLDSIINYCNSISFMKSKISEEEEKYITDLVEEYNKENYKEIKESIKELQSIILIEYANELLRKEWIKHEMENIQKNVHKRKTKRKKR